MADVELTLDELRAQISEGKSFTLVDNFYHNNNILIGTERILSLKDVDRMEGKTYDLLRVREYKESGLDGERKLEAVQLCVRVLKEHPDYDGLLAERRKRVENLICNILPTHEYVMMRVLQIKKASPRLFLHSVNTMIKSLLVDLSWQARHNQGLQDSLRSEELLIGALLRNLGFLKTSRETVARRFGELRNAGDPLFKQVPLLTLQILEADRSHHDLRPNVLRIVGESYELADGSGFPKGLHRDAIHPLALIVATCAEFDLLLAGELTQEKRGFMEINRRMMAMVEKYDRNTINIISEDFRYMRDKRG